MKTRRRPPNTPPTTPRTGRVGCPSRLSIPRENPAGRLPTMSSSNLGRRKFRSARPPGTTNAATSSQSKIPHPNSGRRRHTMSAARNVGSPKSRISRRSRSRPIAPSAMSCRHQHRLRCPRRDASGVGCSLFSPTARSRARWKVIRLLSRNGRNGSLRPSIGTTRHRIAGTCRNDGYRCRGNARARADCYPKRLIRLNNSAFPGRGNGFRAAKRRGLNVALARLDRGEGNTV